MVANRPAEEVAAKVHKLDAEADKLSAEAANHKAAARKAEAEADIAEIEAADERRKTASIEAADARHNVYRFSGGVDGNTVKSCIDTLTKWHRLDPGADIEIIISSGGGAIIAGFQLFDFIRDLSKEGHHIITGCTGMTASMAGILMQAGDHRWMHAEAWYMIHHAAFQAAGKTFDVEDEVAWVKRIETRIIDIFVARSKLTKQKIKRNWDRKDWWIDSDQALEFGLVDEIRGQLG